MGTSLGAYELNHECTDLSVIFHTAQLYWHVLYYTSYVFCNIALTLLNTIYCFDIQCTIKYFGINQDFTQIKSRLISINTNLLWSGSNDLRPH